ncbi:MAG: hypothetical protein U9Q66_01615, partial [Patescibacteria group bacterium]|nr:hypothetical protein [Patescibacteria group bacterium]
MKNTANTQIKEDSVLLRLVKYLVLIFSNYFKRVRLLIKNRDFDNVSIYLNPRAYSKFKWKYYPRYYDVENKETDVSHILLDDDYPEARFAIELFALDVTKVVFLIDTNMKKQPVVNYNNPIAVLIDINNSIKFDKNKRVLMSNFILDSVNSYGVSLSTPTVAKINKSDNRISRDAFFKYIPSVLDLFKHIDYSGMRLLPEPLYNFLLRQNILDKEDPIWKNYILANRNTRDVIKSNTDYFKKLFFDSSENNVINRILFFDTLSDGYPSFKTAWKIEKSRDKFVNDNNLDFWFEDVFKYLTYSNSSESYFSRKYIDSESSESYTVNNPYLQLITHLEKMHNEFLPMFISGTDNIIHAEDYTKKRNFYDILYFLDDLKDNEVIGFVNFNSINSIEDQVNKNTTKLIIKLATIDTKNKEVSFLIDQTKITKKVLDLIDKKLK